MSTLIIILITVSSLATVVAAMIGLIKPQIMSRSSAVSPGEKYYSAMYAARAIPLGLLAAAAPFAVNGFALRIILLASAMAQLGDSLIGTKKREWGMAIAPAILALLYFTAMFTLT